MNNDRNDTICAVSTAPGIGGIAVVRVSGNNAIDVVMKSWLGINLENVPSHTAHFGRIIDKNAEILDEVVIVVFRAPNTFTGEDIVEISCHGSLWVQQQLLNLLIQNGCRIATGGEFTQRAFLNGKIDLSQAEAIADVIASSSRASHRIAINQMRGGFSRELSLLREQLLEFVSLIELELDFSEEEVEFADRVRLTSLAQNINDVISRLANSFSVGNAIKNGVPVAIVGETNVGKSTLLNHLLHEDRALVSNIHGTTRDVIEDTITIQGTLFRFIDTAGIRDTTDEIENMGIERTFKKLDEANIAMWVIDGNAPLTEILEMGKNIISRTENKTLI
ncbi:MAG: tRNA uridine-5-carboxymethylaminomethyl(34) synthesis GTPase MnmE, partial [Muribaculaceae bacterium]